VSVFFSILCYLLLSILLICCKQLLLYSCMLSKIGVIFISFAISVFVSYSVQMCPAIFLIYFNSAAVILVASLALMVQFSLPYNRAGSWTIITYSVETGSLNKPRTNWHTRESQRRLLTT
jgi:hypothetical protein